MKWSITIPGAPPSVNHIYTPTIFTRNGVRIRGQAKKPEIERYQVATTLIVRAAKPSAWKWNGGQVRIYYDFILKREIDTDNAKKVINDAIATALGMDDKYFLGCDRSKSVNGKERDPRVIVEIDDESI